MPGPVGCGGSRRVLELVAALIPLLGAIRLVWRGKLILATEGPAGCCCGSCGEFFEFDWVRWGSCGPWIEHSDQILAGFDGGFGAVEAGVEVGVVPEAHPGVGAHGGVRQPGAPRLPGRSALAGRVPGLRDLLEPRARRAAAMARMYGARGAGGGEPGPCRGVRDPLELLRVHDLSGVGSLRAP